MARLNLKKRRLMVGMTQTEVANAMGVSQPNYQRWESAAAPIPEAKLKKLAKVLKTTTDEILGKPRPFDLCGVDKTIEDARRYFGEITIHFSTNSAPLLLSISEEARTGLYRQLGEGGDFILVESLANQTVLIRRAAVKDVYISSEAFDTFGPDSYEGYIGVFPDEEFWQIVEELEAETEDDDLIEAGFEQSRIDDVRNTILLTEAQVDGLIAEGKVTAEDREQVLAKASEKTERFYDRATKVTWQMSTGQLRRENFVDGKDLYNALSGIEVGPDELDDMICLPAEGYHRTIFINKHALDYLSVPTHKFNAGALKASEEKLDNS